MKTTSLIITVSVFFLPAAVFAQAIGSSSSDGTAPVATAAAAQPGSVVAPRATGGVVRTVVPNPVTSPSLSVIASPSASNSSNFGLIATATAVVASFGVLGFGLLRKNNQQNNKEDNRCDSIKSLLEQKKQDLEDMVRGWPSDKAQDVAKDKILEQLAKNEKVGEVVSIAEDLKEKYDQLQTTIEKLQQRYDLCMINLNLKPTKRVFIIHGWTGNPNQHWMPWLAKKLQHEGYAVYQPEMPETDAPRMNAWISHLKDKMGKADEDTYLVGHSIGCLTILRYLEKYGEKIGGAVLVAPWITLNPESFAAAEDKAVVDEWTSDPFDWQKIKTLCANFVALFSKDDPEVPFTENEAVFRNKLGARIIVSENDGHFTADAGVTELPNALQAILSFEK